MFYDEFSASERPTVSYAWAARNTRPQVASNERQRRRCNGLLAVDALTEEQYLRLRHKAKAEDVAEYLAQFVREVAHKGYNKLTLILDNCRTHKKKMRVLLSEALQQHFLTAQVEVHFIDLPVT